MKTKLPTICILLATILSGCSQGDIYSCRETKQARTGNWEYDVDSISNPIVFIVKGKNLFRDIRAKELREYITPSSSSENIVVGKWNIGKWNNGIWQLNTIDKIAVWRSKGNNQKVFKCEKK
jgi:hypothetical protein